MNVQILSKEFIKPSAPTPPSLRNYEICLIDEVSPTMNIPVILYYLPNEANSTPRFNHLKSSLSETLTKFYPLTGRYMKDSHLVDCSDQGAEFVEAHVDGRLADLLAQGANLKANLLNKFIPCPIGAADEITDPLLAVQVNMFDCGGLAIGMCISHRVADMSTMSTFICGWAIIANGAEGVERISPSFNAAYFFPGEDNSPVVQLGLPRTKENFEVHKVVTKMFAFNKNAISNIRAKVRLYRTSKRQPSKVQSVLGIIWKALVDINEAKHGRRGDSVAVQAVNLRDRTVPPLPKHSCGNLCIVASAQYVASESEMEFQGFVDLLDESVKDTVKDCANILSQDKYGKMSLINPHETNKIVSNPEMVHGLALVSWCKFPLYEADFGYGKPIWVSSVNQPVRNNVILIDDKDGNGIEAWVSLDEKDMSEFELDCNIKHFTI